MNENDLIKLLDMLRGQGKKAAVLLVRCVGDNMTIASSAPGGAITASSTISGNTRMARNALAAAVIQMLLTPYNSNEECPE